MKQPTFHVQPFPSAACDIFSCTRRAKWFIGRPDGPLNIKLRICEECAKALMESLPEELKPESECKCVTSEYQCTGTVTPPEPDKNQVACSKCGKLFSKQGIHGHERHCRGGK